MLRHKPDFTSSKFRLVTIDGHVYRVHIDDWTRLTDTLVTPGGYSDWTRITEWVQARAKDVTPRGQVLARVSKYSMY